MNRAAFYASIRPSTTLFGGVLSQSQVDGINVILNEWDRRALPDARWLAYMLATTFHETARTMQPIAEVNGELRRYAPYYGRGFVQLTWQANYRRASTVVAVDLVASPDRAMEPAIAVKIMFSGMIEGWFTSQKLADYIHGDVCDYVNARRIINGTDRATLIAAYAVQFQRAIEAAATVQAAMPTHDQPVFVPAEPKPPPKLLPRQPDDPGPVAPAKPAPSGLFAALANILAAIFAALFGKGH